MTENSAEDSSFTKLMQYRSVERKRLLLSLTITVVVMIIEIIGGFMANSIALLSDAGHMFTHAFAISISLFAIYLARKPPCHHKTYGMYRAEVLAAFINGLFLLLIVAFIMYEAFLRLLEPQPIESISMFLVAVLGLAVNLTSIAILHGSHQEDINVKGVFFHMIGDAASSVGIVIASIVIFYTEWYFLDPLVSFGIAIVIVFWAGNILKDSARVLLEMTPKGVNVHMVEDDLKEKFEEIVDVYDTHMWTITPEIIVFSTHIQLSDSINQDEFIMRVNDYLSRKYNIYESTIQVAFSAEIKSCKMVLEP